MLRFAYRLGERFGRERTNSRMREITANKPSKEILKWLNNIEIDKIPEAQYFSSLVKEIDKLNNTEQKYLLIIVQENFRLFCKKYLSDNIIGGGIEYFFKLVLRKRNDSRYEYYKKIDNMYKGYKEFIQYLSRKLYAK